MRGGTTGPRRRPASLPGVVVEWIERCPIRMARIKAGLTQRGLGALARVSDVTIRILEQGATAQDFRPTPALGRIATALGDESLVEKYSRWRKKGPDVVPTAASA